MTMRRFRRMRRRPAATTDRRTPDERLEAFMREPSLERRERILDRILDDLSASLSVEPWIRAARTLADRLIIGDDAAYYLTVTFAEVVVLDAADRDPELERLSEPEWDAWADGILAGCLRDAGQTDIARLLTDDRKEFDRRFGRGEVEVWGEDEG